MKNKMNLPGFTANQTLSYSKDSISNNGKYFAGDINVIYPQWLHYKLTAEGGDRNRGGGGDTPSDWDAENPNLPMGSGNHDMGTNENYPTSHDGPSSTGVGEQGFFSPISKSNCRSLCTTSGLVCGSFVALGGTIHPVVKFLLAYACKAALDECNSAC